MWVATFVPKTIFRRSMPLKQMGRKCNCWTIQTHSNELKWTHLKSGSCNGKVNVWPRPLSFINCWFSQNLANCSTFINVFRVIIMLKLYIKCRLLYRYWWDTKIFPFTKKSYPHRPQWRYYFYLSRVRILVSPWLLTLILTFWNRKYKYYCLYFSFITLHPSFITFLWQAFCNRWPL